MVKLAIEIGADNVRAAVRKDGEYIVAPIGSVASPYVCPPIGLYFEGCYVFGEVAKVNAVSRPCEIVFLSDYYQNDIIDKNVMASFVHYLCHRVTSVFKERVDDITILVPSFQNNPSVKDFLRKCIIDSGFKAGLTPDPTLSFVKSYFNVAHGEKVCIVDMRDLPSYVAVVSRSPQAYSTIGSSELAGLSILDCENMIEERISGADLADIDTSDNVISAWIQSEIGSSLSQYGLMRLIEGDDAIIPLPHSSDNCKITQSDFKKWATPRIGKIWSQIQTLFQNISTSGSQVNRVVLLGTLFRSEFICDFFKKCFIGYGCKSEFSVLSKPIDDWAMCLSSLKTNFQSGGFALEL